MADNTLPFRISTGLKNIIGRDLITDDYVAVFELVKNSFDAYAREVSITFESNKIIIRDDGKGMDLEDIKNKWLFVAYSAKREGVEDEELARDEFDLYRNKIQVKKYYAGAKGIGRFSCDRLGSKLVLKTKKASVDSKLEQIEIDWKDFESNAKEDFLNINVTHRTISPFTKADKEFENGTILEISDLNSNWTREKKVGLKKSLEKLINPLDNSSESKEDVDVGGKDEESENPPFKILIKDTLEKQADKKELLPRNRVNGEVKNFVFETLNLKTTQILTEIDEPGEYINISIKDRGTLIYKIKRKNNSQPRLYNIKFNLFFLNRTAKTNFTRIMGIQPVHFGSIFLYKNGFRIAPYGDAGDDSFGLAIRKGQKYNKVSVRDLIGRIEIIGENIHFREVSSRNGGLVRNEYYQALHDCFIENCLEKLENYLQKVSWKVAEDKDQTDVSALNNLDSKSAIIEVIADELTSRDTELEDLDRDFTKFSSATLVQPASEEVIQNLRFIAQKLQDNDFSKDVTKAEELNTELVEKLALEQEELRKAEEEVRRLEEELEAERKENLFNKKIAGSDIKEIISLQHHIDRATEKIDRNIDDLIHGLDHNFGKPQLLKFVEKISLENKKISTVAQFVTNANFNIKAASITKDLIRFIKDYVENVHQEYEHLKLNRHLMNVEIHTIGNPFIISFKPIEIIMVLDNLFSNSYKANARNVDISLRTSDQNIFQMEFQDDGKGIPDANLPRIFNLGFTTTDGSGIGLYHVAQIVKRMKGEIIVNNQLPKGVNFTITFK
jgi:signal transduction histidine kinase